MSYYNDSSFAWPARLSTFGCHTEILMEANTGNHASPNWRALYEAAVLELDPGKVPARIAEAQRGIMNQMEDVNRSDGSESEALLNALNVLQDLRKMAEADGRCQRCKSSHEP